MKNPSWFKKARKNDHESGSSRGGRGHGIPPPPLPEHFVGQRRRVEDSPPRRDRRYVPLAECWEHWDVGIPISHHDVSLPGGWHRNFDRVPIPPAPRVGTAALHEEMRRRIREFPEAQRYDRKFYNEDFWAAFLAWEHEARRRSRFLGDRLPWQQEQLVEMPDDDDDHDDREAQVEVPAAVPYDGDAHFEAEMKEAMARSVADEAAMWPGMEDLLRQST
jgi:hypothetical protein